MNNIYTCDKCSGKGRIEVYAHIDNGVCFKCSGKGTLPYNPDKTRFSGIASTPEPDYDAYIQAQEREFWRNYDLELEFWEVQQFYEENGFEAD